MSLNEANPESLVVNSATCCQSVQPTIQDQNTINPFARYKLVFLVRTDLNMGTGKMCAQCGHAVSAALEEQNEKIKLWKIIGEKKVALKADQNTMVECIKKATELKIPCGIIHDAGHTQVDPGTATVGWIGPWDELAIDQISGSLKLL